MAKGGVTLKTEADITMTSVDVSDILTINFDGPLVRALKTADEL